MLYSPKTHFLNRRSHQLAKLNNIPDLRRNDFFLREQLASARATARKAERLSFNDRKLAEKFIKNSRRLDDIEHVLSDLNKTVRDTSRALIPKRHISENSDVTYKSSN